MKGLTLIELMISVALLTIILSVGVPGFGHLIEKYQSNASTSSLKRILIQSRLQAIENETPITVCPIQNERCVNNWDAPITVFSDFNNNQLIDINDSIYLTSQLKNTAGYWQKNRINTPYIKFNQQGHAFSSSTTLLYCPYSKNHQLAKQLIVNFQGRIRVSDYLNSQGRAYSSLAPLACAPMQ